MCDGAGIDNYFDVTRYAIAFARGKRKLLFMARLKYDGTPADATASGLDPRDRCMALMINEPSPDEVAFLVRDGRAVRTRPTPRAKRILARKLEVEEPVLGVRVLAVGA